MQENSRDLLRSAYFFRNLDDTVLQAVAERCDAVHFDQGAIIFEEGDQGDRLFIVLSGEVEVWKHAEADDASLLARYGAGRFFGEMALVDELPRSATAVAAAPSELLSLQRRAFVELVEAFPQLAESVMRSLSAIVRESNDSFVADLHHRNQELEAAYQQLELAQQELLEHERLSNLGKMSNMILHDIRNPVAVLKGYAQVLAAAADDPQRVAEIAARIGTEAARLGHLSGELLDYARGEVRLDMSVIAPSRIIREARIYVDEQIKGSDITLTVNVIDDTPFVADYQRMVRAVLNLLDNARIACKNGGRIIVGVTRSGNMVEFTVEDTGEGMSEATAARMFEPFFTTSNRGGTGLGTVIVRNIVEAHGGSLFVASRERVGTKVTARVPAGLAP